MSQPAVIVDRLSKCYRLGAINRHTLSDELKHLWCKIRGEDPHQKMGVVGHGPKRTNKPFHALSDISFSVRPGEVTGLIGGNGAGKSTLLKILTRITEPTSGEARINGRVASLLEVGTGFHPELTGRENVFMNGAILGMKRAEIASKFDEIVDFSEVERFIDTPVKRYSSGMYVRLAFAVAAHLDSEILLVDEVLAVGDAAFQKKCLGKMRDVTRDGRTVLFVSHNMNAVRSLCDTGLYLKQGQLLATGSAEDVVDRYLHDNLLRAKQVSLRERTDRSGSGDVRATALQADYDSRTQQWCFTLDYEKQKDFEWYQPSARITIAKIDETRLITLDSICHSYVPDHWPRQGRLQARTTPGVTLPPGEYFLHLAIREKSITLDSVQEAIVFSVNDPTPFDWKRIPTMQGMVFVDHSWSVQPSD